jgi:hypothetical protein
MMNEIVADGFVVGLMLLNSAANLIHAFPLA